MTESCGMVQITNLNEPGQFRIGRVGRAYQDYNEVVLKDRWGEYDAKTSSGMKVGWGNC